LGRGDGEGTLTAEEVKAVNWLLEYVPKGGGGGGGGEQDVLNVADAGRMIDGRWEEGRFLWGE